MSFNIRAKMMRKRTVALFFTILVLLLFAIPAPKTYACSCAGGDAKWKLEHADAVFVGKVASIGGTQRHQIGRLREYTFQVRQSWKGAGSDQITIYSYDGSEASCGTSFSKGQTYLVYSYKANNKLQTNLCSGNLPIEQAQQDVQQLGAGTLVPQHSDGLANSGEDERGSPSNAGLYIATAAIVVSALWLYRQRKKGQR